LDRKGTQAYPDRWVYRDRKERKVCPDHPVRTVFQGGTASRDPPESGDPRVTDRRETRDRKVTPVRRDREVTVEPRESEEIQQNVRSRRRSG